MGQFSGLYSIAPLDSDFVQVSFSAHRDSVGLKVTPRHFRLFSWRLGLQVVTGATTVAFFLGLFYRSATLYHPQRRAILHLKVKCKPGIAQESSIFGASNVPSLRGHCMHRREDYCFSTMNEMTFGIVPCSERQDAGADNPSIALLRHKVYYVLDSVSHS